MFLRLILKPLIPQSLTPWYMLPFLLLDSVFRGLYPPILISFQHLLFLTWMTPLWRPFWIHPPPPPPLPLTCVSVFSDGFPTVTLKPCFLLILPFCEFPTLLLPLQLMYFFPLRLVCLLWCRGVTPYPPSLLLSHELLFPRLFRSTIPYVVV